MKGKAENMGNQYWLEGKVSIPEEKREDFNEDVLHLLRLCGIRKIREVEVGGKKITVVREPRPDEKGIVEFDYSIFEQQKREVSFYDMNTCELHADDCGYREFCVVMNLVMVMQEACSVEHCYFMEGDRVSDVYGYATVIERVIGLKLSFTNREKIWDMLLFFKSSEKYREITYKDIWDIFPYGYGEIDIKQLISCFISSFDSAHEPENYVRTEKSEIKHAKSMQRAYYAYELFLDLLESGGGEKVRMFLQNLLGLDIAGRERLAQNEDAFAELAEISLYELPEYIVAAYGWALREEFWQVWFSLGITGYRDIYKDKDIDKEAEKQEPEKEKSEGKKRLFYKVLQRSNEDEFLEFMENQELYLSDDMRKNLAEWKERYEAADEAEASDIHTESYLADILLELQNIWNCRYVDEEMVKEFIGNADDIRYKKALLVFREIMDWILVFFPELTRKQIREWVMREWSGSEERTELSGYASLLTNHARRSDLLGF